MSICSTFPMRQIGGADSFGKHQCLKAPVLPLPAELVKGMLQEVEGMPEEIKASSSPAVTSLLQQLLVVFLHTRLEGRTAPLALT